MLTEEKAREKWCPFVHVRITIILPSGDRKSEQRAERLGRDDRCMASSCMAWRCGGNRPGAIVERIKVQPLASRPDNFTGYSDGDWIRQETHAVGYCGLAGNPEGVL